MGNPLHQSVKRRDTDDPGNADILIYRQPTGASFTDPTIIHWIKLEKGNRATDYSAAPEDAEEALELKLASVRAQISTEADGIRSEVQANYALASDMSQVRTQVGTLAEQTENNYTWAVTRINQMQQVAGRSTSARAMAPATAASPLLRRVQRWSMWPAHSTAGRP